MKQDIPVSIAARSLWQPFVSAYYLQKPPVRGVPLGVHSSDLHHNPLADVAGEDVCHRLVSGRLGGRRLEVHLTHRFSSRRYDR